MRVLEPEEEYIFESWPCGIRKRCVRYVWYEQRDKKGCRIAHQSIIDGVIHNRKITGYHKYLWLGVHNNELYRIFLRYNGELLLDGYGAKTTVLELTPEIEKEIIRDLPEILKIRRQLNSKENARVLRTGHTQDG